VRQAILHTLRNVLHHINSSYSVPTRIRRRANLEKHSGEQQVTETWTICAPISAKKSVAAADIAVEVPDLPQKSVPGGVTCFRTAAIRSPADTKLVHACKSPLHSMIKKQLTHTQMRGCGAWLEPRTCFDTASVIVLLASHSSFSKKTAVFMAAAGKWGQVDKCRTIADAW
jgi:hypothetical protein